MALDDVVNYLISSPFLEDRTDRLMNTKIILKEGLALLEHVSNT